MTPKAAQYGRLPAGHGEGWLEAMGNLYRSFAQCVRAKGREGQLFIPALIDYPPSPTAPTACLCGGLPGEQPPGQCLGFHSTLSIREHRKEQIHMARPVTLFTIQWGDLPLEEICALAQKMGYEGLELSAAHLDMKRAAC